MNVAFHPVGATIKSKLECTECIFGGHSSRTAMADDVLIHVP